MHEELHLPEYLENDWGPVDRFQVQRSLGLKGAGGGNERIYYGEELAEFLNMALKTQQI